MRKVEGVVSKEFTESRFHQNGDCTLTYRVIHDYRLSCGHLTRRVESVGSPPSKRLGCKACLAEGSR